VQQADGQRLDAVVLDGRQQRLDRGVVQGCQDPALPVAALAHRPAQVAGDQGRQPVGLDVVLVEAVLVGHLQRIAVAFGDDQRDLRPLALDQRVGGQRRPVDDQADVAGRGSARFQDLQGGCHEALGRVGRRRQDLLRGAQAALLYHRVGEGAADIDGQSARVGCVGHCGEAYGAKRRQGKFIMRPAPRNNDSRSAPPGCNPGAVVGLVEEQGLPPPGRSSLIEPFGSG
jgi:hypothetical protein